MTQANFMNDFECFLMGVFRSLRVSKRANLTKKQDFISLRQAQRPKKKDSHVKKIIHKIILLFIFFTRKSIFLVRCSFLC